MMAGITAFPVGQPFCSLPKRWSLCPEYECLKDRDLRLCGHDYVSRA